MGLILDLAVAALALAVIGSLALLDWTLAVSAVRVTHRGRAHITARRQSVTDAEARIRSGSARASSTMVRLSDRYAKPATPGDRSDR